MSLTCICGDICAYNMGNLKTATMTYLTKLDCNNGRLIGSNYHLDCSHIPNTFLENVGDLLIFLAKNDNVTVSLDELSSWFSCYVKPKDETLFLAELAKQTRKLKQKVYYTSQYFEQANRSLRVLTHRILQTQKFHYENGTFIPCIVDDCYKHHHVGIREVRNINDNLIPITNTVYFEMPDIIFCMYDTNEVIMSDALKTFIGYDKPKNNYEDRNIFIKACNHQKEDVLKMLTGE